MGAAEVKGTIDSAPIVRIIDASLDEKGFEYDTTDATYEKLTASGVQIEGSPHYPKTTGEFFDALNGPGEFNTLLLVAHGEVTAGDNNGEAVRVKTADLICPWLLLAQADAELQDKLVLLAVCGGLCDDTIWTFIRGNQLALFLVGSTEKVTGAEVEAFVPPFLAELKAVATSGGSFNPEQVRQALEKCNPAANNKFDFYSGVGELE